MMDSCRLVKTCAVFVQTHSCYLCNVLSFEMFEEEEYLMAKIVIVDDEREILEPLQDMLEGENHSVRAFDDPLRALDYFKGQSADLAILDIKMPSMDGYELLRQIRSFKPDLPIIFLSSKQEEQDQIIGFTLGADDFIGKPFSKHLLTLRVKSVLRRHEVKAIDPERHIEVGALAIDVSRHLVTWNGESVQLTVTECLLLIALSERPGTIKKRDQLMDAAYDGNVYVADRTIDSHVRNIRSKFKEVDVDAELIGTVHGLGYKLTIK